MSKSKNMPSIEDAKQLRMPLQEILLATNGFADENLIGRGGFGPVYKGKSEKHGRIAVKRLEENHSYAQGEPEFKAEIALLSKSKHENIVSLIGFCDEYGEKILVYRYESKGSLDKHLNNKDLTWIKRLQICLDVACGLEYVGSELGIYHRDVKSPNILLDDKWKAKISDFGLSRVGSLSSFVQSNPCGTPGYMDPYYINDGILSQKSDVYSFGVVLWEVVCGTLAHVSKYKNKNLCFAMFVKKHYEKETLLEEIIPSYLRNQIKINPNSFNMFTKIAYHCLKSIEDRPTMKQVVEQLQEALHNQQEVKKPMEGKTRKLVMKGVKAVPLKVQESVQKESLKVLKPPVEDPKKLEQGQTSKREVNKDKAVKKPEEGKKVEKEAKLTARDEKRGKKSKDPPLQEVVLKVLLDCDGCVSTVRKCLKKLKDVEKVETDRETHKVVVKGTIADPFKIANIVYNKINRKVEILWPVQKLPTEEPKKPEQQDSPKQEKKKDELPPPETVVVLEVPFDCEVSTRDIKNSMMKVKGVETVVPDLNNSQVDVTGEIMDNNTVIVRQDPTLRVRKRKPRAVKKIETSGDNTTTGDDANPSPSEENQWRWALKIFGFCLFLTCQFVLYSLHYLGQRVYRWLLQIYNIPNPQSANPSPPHESSINGQSPQSLPEHEEHSMYYD